MLHFTPKPQNTRYMKIPQNNNKNTNTVQCCGNIECK